MGKREYCELYWRNDELVVCEESSGNVLMLVTATRIWEIERNFRLSTCAFIESSHLL
jgi:hypothetical protein